MCRLAIILGLLCGFAPGVLAQPAVGSAAPNFTLNLAGGGGSVTLSNYLGEVVYLNFFGATCPVCIEDGPLSQEIYEMYDSVSDVNIFGIDVWNLPSFYVNTTFRTNSTIQYPLMYNGRATGIAYNMEVESVPSTTDIEHRGHLVIDQQGIIRYYAIYDPLGVEQQQEIIATIESLLDPCAGVPLDPPQSAVMLFNDSTQELKFCWQPTPCASRYLVYRSVAGDWNDTELFGTTTDAFLPLPNYPEGMYIFRVVAERIGNN